MQRRSPVSSTLSEQLRRRRAVPPARAVRLFPEPENRQVGHGPVVGKSPVAGSTSTAAKSPLEGKVYPPTGRGMAMPRRRGKWLTRDVPIFVGGIISLGTFVLFGFGSLVGGTGLIGPALGALAVGAAVAGGSAYLLRNRRPEQEPLRAVSAAVPEGTRAILEAAASSALTQRRRISDLSRRAKHSAAAPVLSRADALLVRIDALLRTEVVQSRRPYDEDVMLLEGMSARYVPELLGAAEDNLGFLTSLSDESRQRALENLQVIDDQLAALNDGVDRIESEVVGGAARSLDVQREFLRTRLGSQRTV